MNKVDRNKIESYLAIKYGLTLEKNRNYVSSKNVQIWSKDNQSFWNRITGIGRDDYSELYQKQSTSSLEDKQLIISNGILVDRNSLNSSVINDSDFLVWGDDNKAIALSKDTIKKELIPIKRKWLMQATGNSASLMNTQIRFKVSDLFKDISKDDNKTLWLIKSKKKDDYNFASELDLYTADKIEMSEYAEFSDIRWDENQDGKDVFSFAIGPKLLMNLRVKNPSCNNYSSQMILQVIGGKSPYSVTIKNQKSPFQQSYSIEDSELNISGLAAGEYDIQIADSKGNKYSKLVAIDASKLFALDLGLDKVLNKGETLVLDASKNIADEKVSYLWTSTNGFTSTSSKVTLNQAGDYTVRVVSSEGCQMEDTFSLSYSDQLIGITISPNPTSVEDGIKVKANLRSIYDIKAKVYDASGKLIDMYKSNGMQNYNFVLKIPSEGVYLVVVEAGDEIYSEKVIVK